MVRIPSPLAPLNDPLFEEKQLKVWVKRDDLIHPHIMGNKWRKLKYNVAFAQKEGYQGLLTFGGAYSNHIAATAACAQENGLQSVGVIRGDELDAASNPTLRFAQKQGMKLLFVSREAFRALKENSAPLGLAYPHHLVLPEGGTNALALTGCAEIIEEINRPFDYLVTSLGTGGSMAGLLKGMQGIGQLIGISALKGKFVHTAFQQLLDAHQIGFTNYKIMDQYHFGGYGKVPESLVDWINEAGKKTDLKWDPIYTGKMLYGFMDLVEHDYFISYTKIILLHTGGLQGIAGFNEKHAKKIML